MPWQDPGGNAPSGGPDDDATRADWDLAQLDALVGAGARGATQPSTRAGPPAATEPPAAAPVPAAGPPSALSRPPGPPAWSPPAPAPGYGADPAPGSSPGYPPAAAPGMAWAPPPTYGGPGAPGIAGLEYSGVLVRLVAWLVDVLILGLVGGAISWFLGVIVLGTTDWSVVLGRGTISSGVILDPALVSRIVVLSFVTAVVSTVIDVAYFALQWASTARATLGMRLMRLQIGGEADGRTLSRGQAARRWLAMGSWLSILAALPVVGGLASFASFGWYLILLITTGTNPRRMGLHDQFAGTAIVQRTGESRSGLAIGCIVLIVLVLVVLPLISIVALVFLGGQVSSILSTVGESI